MNVSCIVNNATEKIYIALGKCLIDIEIYITFKFIENIKE